MNTLIAYYSRRGQNYVSGSIKDLKIGNTEAVAKMIQAQMDADLFEIETVDTYPDDYMPSFHFVPMRAVAWDTAKRTSERSVQRQPC